MSDPIFSENKKNITSLSSAESAHSLVSVKTLNIEDDIMFIIIIIIIIIIRK